MTHPLQLLVALSLFTFTLRPVSAQSKPLSGSFGFLLSTAVAPTSTDGGSAVVGLMNFDGAGNATGSYHLQLGASPDEAGQAIAGNFTGTYSTNPDGTGTATFSFDFGMSFTFTMVVTDGGKGLQLAATGCTDDCDLGGIVLSGVARAAYTGSLKGAYGYQLNNSPVPGQSIGVMSLDGAGNVALSLTFVGAGSGPNYDPHQAPVFSGTAAGTYSLNPDGTGTIVLPAPFGQPNNQTFAFVAVDGGATLLMEQVNRAGNGVSSGTARQQ